MFDARDNYLIDSIIYMLQKISTREGASSHRGDTGHPELAERRRRPRRGIGHRRTNTSGKGYFLFFVNIVPLFVYPSFAILNHDSEVKLTTRNNLKSSIKVDFNVKKFFKVVI